MKSEIIELTTNTIGISGSGLSLMYVDSFADKIIDLMCYREVSGMFTAFKEVYISINYETVTAFIVRKLRPVYGEKSVLEAIDKVKNEQNGKKKEL